MSFGSAFIRGVPVLPRKQPLQTLCKTRRAFETDNDANFAPRALKAVSARFSKTI